MADEFWLVVSIEDDDEEDPGFRDLRARVRDAVERASVDITEMRKRRRNLDVRLWSPSMAQLVEAGGWLHALLDVEPDAMDFLRRLPVRYNGPPGAAYREITGFNQVELAAARRWVRSWQEPGTVSSAPEPERRMDVAVRRDGTELAAGAELEPATAYEVLARIGEPFDSSIVDGEVSSIEELLGPGAFELEVTLVSADLEVLGATSQPLDLPAVGPSETVAFVVRTPPREGAVSARLSVFLDGNLVQTFALTGWVGSVPRGEQGLRARSEHLAPAGYARLTHVAPRTLSMVQEPADEGGIQLRTRLSVEHLPTTRVEEHAREVRRLLEVALKDARRTDDTIRALAAKGSDLGLALFTLDAAHYTTPERAELQDRLRRLMRGADETVQVVRLRIHQSFPWAAVYDWQLPDDPLAVPVCRRPDCEHGPAGADAVCLRGFWGVRHRIEEVIGDPSGRAPEPEAAGDRPAALLSLGVDDPYTATLGDELDVIARPGRVARVSGREQLLDRLWDDASRPPVVVLVGHHRWTGNDPASRHAEIQVSPDGERMTANHLAERLRFEQPWEAPEPVVLLLACSVAAVEPTDLGSFLNSFHSANAAAVVGAECQIRVPSAARIARSLVSSLLGGQAAAPEPLAAAVRRVRTDLAYEGDLSGFALTAVGSGDSVLA